jgi:DeoR/GlpR family transcriptional regulator of sugar metabolism
MNVEAHERLELKRRRLDTDPPVRVAELAVELDVSEMTVRRDLDMLVDEGIAQRVRGGAVAVGPQEFATRFRQHARA